MGQFIFSTLFIIALLAGAYAYICPTQNAINQMKLMVRDNNNVGPDENITTVKSEQLNINTHEGRTQIRQLIDDTCQQQQKFIAMMKDEQQVLDGVDKEIADIKNQVHGPNNIDLLRLKSLEEELQDDQRLLVDQGKALISLNNQLTKSRQWLAEQSDLTNMNTQSSLDSLQQHSAIVNTHAETIFDDVKQRNNEIMQHTQEVIEQERQKLQDEQYR